MTVPQLPGFRYVKPLGRGGYGEVFSAYQDRFDRWVAVKVLSFTLTDERLQRQFVRECRLAGRLSAHPNIVTVYDSGIVTGGRPYITMELFADGSIADAQRVQGTFAVPDALRIGIALAGALETAHGAGVVHRDVKPANVLLATYGQPALADFGLSVVTERHEVSAGVDALTPCHAAPEVLERTVATRGSDVYSLASTLYAMLAGRAPHQSRDDSPDSIAALLLRVLQRDVPPLTRPDVPPSLRDALGRALARDPAARTPSAAAFAAELQAVQRELGQEVTEPVVMEIPGAVEAPAAPEPRAGLVIPPPPPPPLPPPPPPPPPPPEAEQEPVAGTPAPPKPPDPSEGSGERPPLPSRTPNRPAAAAPSNGDGERSTNVTEPSLDQLAALERALLGQPPPRAPVSPAERTRRPPPAPLRRRPDAPAPPRTAASAPPEAPEPSTSAPEPPAPPPPPEPPRPPVPPEPPAAPEQLPDWVTEAVEQPAAPVGFSDEPDGDTTIERQAVRAYLPPPAPAPVAPAPRERSRLVPVLAAVVVVAGLAAAVFALLGGKDDDGGNSASAGNNAGEQAVTSTTLPPPTGLEAVESAAGVQLDWEGDESEVYAVLMMSESAEPQVLPAESGTSLLVAEPLLLPDDGYCFAVAYLSGLQAASPSSEDAFGPPTCIRGASEDTVRPG
jgi:serine/threonine protein kinase